MSYVLDALKKADAERDRERGDVPGLYAQPAPLPPSRDAAPTRLLPWALGGGIAVAALVIGAWRWADDGSSAPAPAVPAAPPPAAPAMPVPAPSPAPAPAAIAEPLAAAPTPVPSPTTAPAPLAGPLPPAAPRPAAAAPPPSARAPLAKEPLRPRTSAAPAAAPAAPATPAEPPVTAARRGSPAAAKPASAPARLPTLADLPPELRAEIPKITVGGVMHSADAANRLLIVNGQVLHEGDRPAPGLTLVRIDPRSAVLEWKGQRFTLGY